MTGTGDWASLLNRTDVLILDTETTGLDSDAEVIEVSVINTRGDLRMDELALPVDGVPQGAANIHGLTLARLRQLGARQWRVVNAELRAVLADASLVLVYNASYDRRLLEQTCVRHGLSLPTVPWRCVMLEYADLRREPNPKGHGWKWHKLDEACHYEGVSSSQEHRALSDTRMTLALMRTVVAKENAITEERDQKIIESIRKGILHAPGIYISSDWRLNGVELSGAELSDAGSMFLKMNGANLRGADLSNASFYAVTMNGADLRGANLENADISNQEDWMRGADLRGANLSSAHLGFVFMEGTDLRGANLSSAKMYCTYLNGADLRGAILVETNLSSAYLRGADLRGVHFSKTNLREASLQGADVRGAFSMNADWGGGPDLRDADLRNANFNASCLYRAKLEGADVRGACFDFVDLTEADMDAEALRAAGATCRGTK